MDGLENLVGTLGKSWAHLMRLSNYQDTIIWNNLKEIKELLSRIIQGDIKRKRNYQIRYFKKFSTLEFRWGYELSGRIIKKFSRWSQRNLKFKMMVLKLLVNSWYWYHIMDSKSHLSWAIISLLDEVPLLIFNLLVKYPPWFT